MKSYAHERERHGPLPWLVTQFPQPKRRLNSTMVLAITCLLAIWIVVGVVLIGAITGRG